MEQPPGPDSGEPGYSFPLLKTAPYRQVPVPGQPAVDKTGPLAGPVAPGDEILLMSGNYGDVWIGGTPEISNSDFVTVGRARADARPDIAFRRRNQQVGVQRPQGAKSPTRRSQRQRAGPGQGRGRGVSDIRHCAREYDHLIPGQRRGLEQSPMGRERAHRVLRPSTAAGTNTKCISFTGSHISNVKTGASLSANQLVFSNNQIDHFGDDGIDYAASNLAITKNNIHDNLDIGDGNHEDAMQGVIGVLTPGVAVNYFQNILIDSNLIIRQTDPELSFPTYLQGIDAFDSDWTNMTVTNNVIVTSSCYTIGIGEPPQQPDRRQYGVGRRPGFVPRLHGDDKHRRSDPRGSDSSNVRVTNNLAEHFFIEDNGAPTVTFDHNVALNSYQPFVHWNGTGGRTAIRRGRTPRAISRLQPPSPTLPSSRSGILRR